jgi:hypothetical protein
VRAPQLTGLGAIALTIAVSAAATQTGLASPGPARVAQSAPLPQPVVGTFYNMYPVSGVVYLKLPKHLPPGASATQGPAASAGGPSGFAALTAPRRLPAGTEVDALHGTMRLTSAAGIGRRTQTVTLGGAVFGIKQQKTGLMKGLATFSLLEGDIKGGPTFASCSPGYTYAGDRPSARAASASPKVLQTLTASEHGGHFRTKGRYSAATVRGTTWVTEDRCDGTLTVVKRGAVDVFDNATRKTITLNAGQSFLAKP